MLLEPQVGEARRGVQKAICYLHAEANIIQSNLNNSCGICW